MKDQGEYLDTATLDELKQVMGDEFTLLIETFSNDSVLRIDSIKAAVESSEPEAIRRTAHSFKGSASNMGAPRLTELCRMMEELGYNGQIEGSKELLEQIVEEYQRVHEALIKY